MIAIALPFGVDYIIEIHLTHLFAASQLQTPNAMKGLFNTES